MLVCANHIGVYIFHTFARLNLNLALDYLPCVWAAHRLGAIAA